MKKLLGLLALLPAIAFAQPNLPISANNGPTTSAQLRSVLTDETGNGLLVFQNGNLGAATATSINGTPIPASTTILALSGSPIGLNNVAVGDGTGLIKDSTAQLITSLCAGCLAHNPTSNPNGPVAITGVLGMTNGTPALPSHSFYNDLTSGMYLQSTNVLGMAVGGVQLFRMQKPSSTALIEFAAGGTPLIRAVDSAGSTNFSLILAAANAGTVDIEYNGASNDAGTVPYMARFTSAGVGVSKNYPVFTTGGTGQAIRMTATGADTDISVNLIPKGAGTIQAGGSPVLTNASLGSGVSTALATAANATGGVVTQMAPTSWTPADASGASLTITVVSASYIKIGRMCLLEFIVTYPSTADASAAKLSGIPATCAGLSGSTGQFHGITGPITGGGAVSGAIGISTITNSTTIYFNNSNGGASNVTNALLTGATMRGTIIIITGS